MGLLPDTQNCGLCMHREYRERFPRHRLQTKPLVSDPDMHHGTCVTHVPWCKSGSLNRGGWENAPGLPGACATCNITHLARGLLQSLAVSDRKQHVHGLTSDTTWIFRSVSCYRFILSEIMYTSNEFWSRVCNDIYTYQWQTHGPLW